MVTMAFGAEVLNNLVSGPSGQTSRPRFLRATRMAAYVKGTLSLISRLDFGRPVCRLMRLGSYT